MSCSTPRSRRVAYSVLGMYRISPCSSSLYALALGRASLWQAAPSVCPHSIYWSFDACWLTRLRCLRQTHGMVRHPSGILRIGTGICLLFLFPLLLIACALPHFLSRTTATGIGRVGMGPGRLSVVVVVLFLLGYARERASLPAVLLAAAPSLFPDSKARPRAGPELTD